MNESADHPLLRIVDLGRISYDDAYRIQVRSRDELISASGNFESPPRPMTLLLLEHDPPVITISKRPDARRHLRASHDLLDKLGIEVRATDRGGDITYHGPGQLIAYAILDLKRLGIGVRDYMRLLEGIVINTIRHWGIQGVRDPSATGVWVPIDIAVPTPAPAQQPREIARTATTSPPAKICALGVRVSKWVTMHGLALNVTTDLAHFDAIIPCGLADRPVTSIAHELAMATDPQPPPDMAQVKRILADEFRSAILGAKK